MSVTVGGWFSWAIRLPGPLSGQNGGKNGGRGVIPHSAVGTWDTPADLLRFLVSRVNAPPNQRSSWAATNMQDGTFYQHYPIFSQTWTSGSAYPNNNFFAFENEGGGEPNYSEPLTPPQLDNVVRVIKELSEFQNWLPERPTNPKDIGASLYEHRECVRFGSAATACPSDRIPWDVILKRLEPEEDVKPYLAWDRDRQRVYLIGPKGATWITSAATVAHLETDLGAMTITYSQSTIDAIG